MAASVVLLAVTRSGMLLYVPISLSFSMHATRKQLRPLWSMALSRLRLPAVACSASNADTTDVSVTASCAGCCTGVLIWAIRIELVETRMIIPDAGPI
jgi:hypothetical protein